MIEFKDVTYTYFANTPFEKLALNIPSLELSMGEYYGVLGPTGSGKSTFLKVLTHLLPINTGSITINETFDDIRKYFGFVFQQPEHQLFCETVREEFEFSLNNFGVDKALWMDKTANALKLVGLSEDFLDKDPLVLSGGQKRRVAIASILAYEPRVLVLDEPTAGVDGLSKEILLDAFRSYHKQGHCIFLVSHDLNIINNECSKAMSFKDGMLLNIGDPFETIVSADVTLTPGLALLKDIKASYPQISTQVSANNFQEIGKSYASK
ncbi:MAG: ATP-binding cassette domain-containing protein [Candidatus Cloacimonetes bacterium]|nr:ATP-binding cassette domain-containing protein [Candidatus Cloacimonadota bacterium]